VIILDNEHCFKEDPEYGQMLKRMWSGDLTKDDQMRINSRVIGTPGLELPPDFEGKQIQAEFSKLKKTVLTHAM
jgi:hypothetical protein